MIEGWFLFPLACVNAVVLAAIAGKSAAGRAAAIAMSVAGLGAPLLAPEDSLMWRFLIAMFCGLLVMRALELWKLGPGLTVRQRVWRVLAYYDTRKAESAPPMMDWANLWTGLAYGALFAAAVLFAGVIANEYDGPTRWAMRWFGGAVGVYAFLDSSGAMMIAMNRALGQRPPKLHDHPILATSVSEFWGARWNLTVASYFREHILWPLGRRRLALLGVALSFVGSAVLHAYIVLVSVGLVMSLYMGAFFLAQIPLVLIERRARMRHWPRPLARAWTVGTILALSPLFVEPAFRVWDAVLAGL